MPAIDFNELFTALKAGKRADLPDSATAAIGLEKASSEEDLDLAVKFLDAIILTFDSHEEGNRYVCAFISVLSPDNVRRLIARLSAETIKQLVFENEYIPHRSVQIAVDIALRYRDSDKEKCSVYLNSLYRRTAKLFPERICEISPSVVLLANPADSDFEKRRKYLLDTFFESFNYDQLNRLFNKHSHGKNQRWISDFLNAFTNDRVLSEQGLLNAFILCAVYAPHKTLELRRANLQRKEEILTENRLYSDFLIVSGGGFSKYLKREPQISRRRNIGRNTRLRVAFLLSGQMRGYKEAFSSWHDSFKLDDIDPVFFVHTWKTIGRKALVGAHAQRHFPEPLASTFLTASKDIKDIDRRYPELHKLFRSKEEVEAGDIFETYNPRALWVDEDDILGDVPNQSKMYYKIQGCYRLAASSLEEFDLVVRVRPDKKFAPQGDNFDWWDIYEKCKIGNVFSDFSPIIMLHQGVAIGDQLLISSPEAAHIISHAWDIVKKAHELDTRYFPKTYVPHGTLGAICHAHGYEVRKTPGLNIPGISLCDAAPIRLDQIEQALERDILGRNDEFDQKLLQALLMSR